MNKHPEPGVAGGRPAPDSENDWLTILDRLVERRDALDKQLGQVDQRIVLVSQCLVAESRLSKEQDDR